MKRNEYYINHKKSTARYFDWYVRHIAQDKDGYAILNVYSGGHFCFKTKVQNINDCRKSIDAFGKFHISLLEDENTGGQDFYISVVEESDNNEGY